MLPRFKNIYYKYINSLLLNNNNVEANRELFWRGAKMKELVSVIMPVCNNEKYLGEAIESILNQSHENLELLLLDDGSSDGSLSIMESYALSDKRIRIISRSNKGVSCSICELIDYASGDYIARMDGDDASYKYRIETQLKYMKENTNIDLIGSHVDIEITDYKNDDDKLLCEKIFNFKTGDENIEIKILNGNKICHGTFFGKTNLFKSICYSKDFKRTEDIDFILNAIRKGKNIDLIDKKLYLNRVNSKFIHEHKSIDERFNQENLISKIKFLYDEISKRNIFVIGESKYKNQLIEILKNKFGLSAEKIDEVDLREGYTIILDKINSHDIESKLILGGKKKLKDFVLL